jgi:predicted TIM-barrel fold metal-dependent hydrolase
MDPFPIVDAHHHIWDTQRNYHPWLRDEPPIPFRYGDYRAIRGNYMPADYRRDTRHFTIVKSVYVEAEWDHHDPIGETRWVHEVADAQGLPTAIVAQAWLDCADVSEVLSKQAAFPRVRSVRHKPKSLPRADAKRGQPGSMDCPLWRAGYALLGRHGVHFDLQTNWWHFNAAAELARDFPNTTIIVNHTGLPSDRSLDGLAGWRAAMAHLARETNVMLKISGIGVPGQPWTPALNGGIVSDAIGMFGADRCMFASNFPVDNLVATFDQIFGGFMEITAAMPALDRRKLFHDNAVRIYRL